MSLSDFPRQAAEYMEKENGRPARNVNARSRQHVLWKCQASHIYKRKISTHTRQVNPQDCPCLACYNGARVNLNDLPSALKQYDRSGRNHGFDFKNRPAWFNVYWGCETNPSHVWYKPITSLEERDFECLRCHRLKCAELMGTLENFLELKAQIHPSETEVLSNLSKLTRGSHKIITWQRSQGPDHAWEAPLSNRAIKDAGCPFCANRRVSVTNCLATVMPGSARNLHPKNNGACTGETIIAATSKPFWWFCRLCNHKSQRSPRYHSVRKGRYPKCKTRDEGAVVAPSLPTPDPMVPDVKQPAGDPSKTSNLLSFEEQTQGGISAGDLLPRDRNQNAELHRFHDSSETTDIKTHKNQRWTSAGDALTCDRNQNKIEPPTNKSSGKTTGLAEIVRGSISAGNILASSRQQIELEQSSGYLSKCTNAHSRYHCKIGDIYVSDMLTCVRKQNSNLFARAP